MRAAACIVVLVSLCRIVHAQEPFVQTGVASYYGKEFHGSRTASGEIYSMWQLTAAHQTLPFHTLVKVTNLKNDKSVTVRINDAGPFLKGRIIDLSRQAALALDMIEHGTAKVRLEVVGKAEPPEGLPDAGAFYRPATDAAAPEGFAIQVASYSDERNARRKLAELERKGIEDVYVQPVRVGKKQLQRIVIGGFPTRESAEAALKSLRQKQISGFVFQIR